VNARTGTALMVLCTAICIWLSPGRISVPDDEIVFQTTRSLWERHDLAIEGIPRRTGELEGRPDGTFGWAPGVDGKRYGFFGHGLSIVALPAYGAGKAMAARAPDVWRHAVRSNHYWVHARSAAEDFPRMVVSLTNCWVVGLGAWLMALWVSRLGYRLRTAVTCGLMYALGTSMLPYAGTFLSEPLSAVWLMAAGIAVSEAHARRERDDPGVRRQLGWAAVFLAASVHTHLLNVTALPAFVGWALWPWRSARARRRQWLAAVAIGAGGLALLGLSHHLRFGDPLQTGRYDHYSHFIVPGDGLLAMLVAPGRSVWLYSPAIVVAAFGWPAFFRRHRALSTMVVVTFVLRWGFVATRSDWWGGWAIGSRYLLPVVPLLLLPLAEVLRDAGRRRWVVAVALLGCVAACAYLAEYSIFDHMLRLSAAGSDADPYLPRSHWSPAASPWVGFSSLDPDMLSRGAAKLAEHGHPGLWRLFLFVAALGGAAAATLGWQLRRSDSDSAAG
jgi:hypothetical protein